MCTEPTFLAFLGLLFYNGQFSSGGADFISLGLSQGVPEFRFNLGYGTAIIRSDRPLTFGQWHSIKVTRYVSLAKGGFDVHEAGRGQIVEVHARE